MSDAAGTLAFFLFACTCLCMIFFCITVHDAVDQFFRLIDSVCNLTLDDFLSVETLHRNLSVCCYNDSYCVCNLFVRYDILCSA